MPHLQSNQTLIDFFTNENAGIGFADLMSVTLRDSYHFCILRPRTDTFAEINGRGAKPADANLTALG